MNKYHIFLAAYDVRPVTPWQVMNIDTGQVTLVKSVTCFSSCKTHYNAQRNLYVMETIGTLRVHNEEGFISSE